MRKFLSTSDPWIVWSSVLPPFHHLLLLHISVSRSKITWYYCTCESVSLVERCPCPWHSHYFLHHNLTHFQKLQLLVLIFTLTLSTTLSLTFHFDHLAYHLLLVSRSFHIIFQSSAQRVKLQLKLNVLVELLFITRNHTKSLQMMQLIPSLLLLVMVKPASRSIFRKPTAC